MLMFYQFLTVLMKNKVDTRRWDYNYKVCNCQNSLGHYLNQCNLTLI